MSFFAEDRANELRALFFESAQELLQTLNEKGLCLEQSPADMEIVREIRRTVHTLKGDSAACGYRDLSELAHSLEDVLTPETASRAGTALAELVLSAADTFEALLAACKENMQPPSGDPLREMIRKVITADSADEAKLPVPGFGWNEYERLVIAKTAKPGCTVFNVGVVVDPQCAMPAAALQLVRRVLLEAGDILLMHPDTDGTEPVPMIEAAIATQHAGEWIEKKCKVPGVVSLVYVSPYSDHSSQTPEAEPATVEDEQEAGEMAEADVATEEHVTEAGALKLSDVRQERARTERPVPATENLLRVEADRIDTVLDLVGELIIAKSTMQQALVEFSRRFPKDPLRGRLADALALQSQVTGKLQRSVMKIRMVPVEQLFRRFPRLVRDLSKSEHKDAQLALQGENTDLDKSILDSLAEPLSHLVRNAISHGIETPEARREKGKSPQGTIRLTAYHQGNQVVIEVSDDGAGIDRQRMVREALAKGILTQEQAAGLTDHEALNLIFEPGFSTAARVTEISGRGVGMDIVRAVIERLKGSISIDTEVGVGTTFRLRLPLTLAIIKALLFHAADRLYAVPLGSVVEIARSKESDVHLLDGHEVLRVREEVLPLIRLDQMTGGRAARKKFFVVVVSTGDRKFGLIVDKLVGEQELVIKALDDQLVATDLVGGASVLGDGHVVLILNLAAVVDRLGRARSSGRKQAANA